MKKNLNKMNTIQFSDLRKANIKRDKFWDPENRMTVAYRGLEMAGEAGEACNVIKKIERELLGLKGTRASIINLADELADVVICVDLIAMEYDIDLWKAVVNKFNETSVKHSLPVNLIF